MERATLRSEAESILGRVADVGGVKVVAARTSAAGPDAMREMGDFLKARLESAVVMLGCVADGNPLLVAMVTPDLVDKGLHAGNLARDNRQGNGRRRRRTPGDSPRPAADAPTSWTRPSPAWRNWYGSR